MRLGSGIKNKILQAWAMALPVVATSESLGGLSAQDGVNLLVRDDLEQFASGVADLILDPQRAATIGAAGRSTAERQYSWQHQAAQLEALLRTVVKGHSLAEGLPVAEQ
jgi:glycosyltransferase involved in cell wall biosynthesis